MTTLRFWKMAGAGNDFVVLDARAGLPLPVADLSRRLCPRRVSVGADGLIAITSVAGGRVTVDFHNADGSPAGFCGNGARWPYDPQQDAFTCPNGKRLTYRWTINTRTRNGSRTQRRVYEGEDCQSCPLKPHCTLASGNRRLKVSFRLWQYREQARQNLLSAEGQRLRSQRGIDVEPVFGRIKEDWGFRRFLLKGIKKVKTEFGLLCIAQNMAKLAVS